MTVHSDLPVWKQIKEYPSYEISTNGVVRSIRTGRVLAQSTKKGSHPYQRVHLSKGGKAKYILVHRLVLTTFVGPCPEGCQALHLDNDPRNNCLTNLVWGTAKQNHSTINRNGSSNGRALLSEDDVRAIRGHNGPLAELTALYPVSQKYLSNIRSNITWKHI